MPKRNRDDDDRRAGFIHADFPGGETRTILGGTDERGQFHPTERRRMRDGRSESTAREPVEPRDPAREPAEPTAEAAPRETPADPVVDRQALERERDEREQHDRTVQLWEERGRAARARFEETQRRVGTETDPNFVLFRMQQRQAERYEQERPGTVYDVRRRTQRAGEAPDRSEEAVRRAFDFRELHRVTDQIGPRTPQEQAFVEFMGLETPESVSATDIMDPEQGLEITPNERRILSQTAEGQAALRRHDAAAERISQDLVSAIPALTDERGQISQEKIAEHAATLPDFNRSHIGMVRRMAQQIEVAVNKEAQTYERNELAIRGEQERLRQLRRGEPDSGFGQIGQRTTQRAQPDGISQQRQALEAEGLLPAEANYWEAQRRSDPRGREAYAERMAEGILFKYHPDADPDELAAQTITVEDEASMRREMVNAIDARLDDVLADETAGLDIRVALADLVADDMEIGGLESGETNFWARQIWDAVDERLRARVDERVGEVTLRNTQMAQQSMAQIGVDVVRRLEDGRLDSIGLSDLFNDRAVWGQPAQAHHAQRRQLRGVFIENLENDMQAIMESTLAPEQLAPMAEEVRRVIDALGDERIQPGADEPSMLRNLRELKEEFIEMGMAYGNPEWAARQRIIRENEAQGKVTEFDRDGNAVTFEKTERGLRNRDAWIGADDQGRREIEEQMRFDARQDAELERRVRAEMDQLQRGFMTFGRVRRVLINRKGEIVTVADKAERVEFIAQEAHPQVPTHERDFVKAIRRIQSEYAARPDLMSEMVRGVTELRDKKREEWLEMAGSQTARESLREAWLQIDEGEAIVDPASGIGADLKKPAHTQLQPGFDPDTGALIPFLSRQDMERLVAAPQPDGRPSLIPAVEPGHTLMYFRDAQHRIRVRSVPNESVEQIERMGARRFMQRRDEQATDPAEDE